MILSANLVKFLCLMVRDIFQYGKLAK